MNSVRRIIKNSGASLVARLSNPASSFVLVFFIAKLLGASGLGKYSSALALLFIFQAISSIGFPYLITREVSQDLSKAGAYLVNASFVGGIFAILSAILMCLVVNIITRDIETIRAVYILSISLIPFTLASVCQSICRGFEKLEYLAIPMVIGNGFKMLAGIYVLFENYGLVYLMVVIVASHFLIFIINLFFAYKDIKNKNQKISSVDIKFCRVMISSTFIYALIMIVATVRMNIDMLLIKKMMGDFSVGIYSAAYKLVNISMHGIACYIMALQPIIFRMFKISLGKFESICTESIRYLLIMILPIIAITTVLSEKIVFLIFKPEFIPSSNVLCILIWLLILTGFNQIYANALIASDHQRVNFHANLIGMIGSICFNIIFIYYMGFIGAALANISATFLTLAYQHLFVSRYLFKINYFKYAKKPLISSILMGGILFIFKDKNLFLSIIISIIIYFVLLYSLRAFTSKDKELIQKLFKGEMESLI